MKFLTILLLISSLAQADEVGLRFINAIPVDNNSLVQFPPGSSGDQYSGKSLEGVYDWEPGRNFYLEGGLGYRSPGDITNVSSLLVEVSPGVRVQGGPVVLKLSEGVAYMPQSKYDTGWDGYNQIAYVTHLTVGLKDSSGVGIYFDRSHYSSGSAATNPSLNYTGFMLQMELP